MKREEFVSHEVFAHSSGTRVILWSHRDEAGVYFDVSCGLGTHLDAAGNKVEEGARLSSKEEAFKAVELYVEKAEELEQYDNAGFVSHHFYAHRDSFRAVLNVRKDEEGLYWTISYVSVYDKHDWAHLDVEGERVREECPTRRLRSKAAARRALKLYLTKYPVE